MQGVSCVARERQLFDVLQNVPMRHGSLGKMRLVAGTNGVTVNYLTETSGTVTPKVTKTSETSMKVEHGGTLFRIANASGVAVWGAAEGDVFPLLNTRPGWTITKEWEGYTLEADIAFKDIQPADYAGIFFSGGRAPEYIRDDEDLIRITRWFWEQKKPCASVCHGVEIPARAGIVKGLRMATVAKCRFDLEVCGGIYVNEPCVIDRHMVSGRTFHDNGHYVGPWIRMLDASLGRR